MQLNLYIFNQLFRTFMALITVLISIIWLFQSIRLLEFVVDKGASVGEFFAMSVASMPLWLMITCLLYTSPSPRDQRGSRMPSSA